MPAADLRSLTEELRSDFAAYTGCVSGASPVAAIKQALREAGFTAIEVLIKEGSRRQCREQEHERDRNRGSP